MEAVDRILTERAREHAGRSRLPGLAGTVLLHGLAVASIFLLPALRKPPKPLEFVPVQIIPAQALGVEKPRGRREAPAPPKPEARKPEPPAPAPPEPAPREIIPPIPRPQPELPPREKLAQALKNQPQPPAPKPTPAPAKPVPPAPAPPARGTAKPQNPQAAPPQTGADFAKGEEAGRRGSAQGSAVGTSAFGSSIAGLEDPNFNYGYYIDRLLQQIDAEWARPALGGEVKAVIYFRIQRGGAIEDLRVAESSGYNSFDIAALRAVQNAAPFPALPASYRPGSLGVTLIVR